MPATISRMSPADMARGFNSNFYRDAYAQGITVSQLCERMNPTSELPDDERGLDAFERVLREAGIVTRSVPEIGLRASTFDEATNTTEKRAMMLEWASRVWRAVSAPGQVSAGQRNMVRAILLDGDAAVNTIAKLYDDDTTIRAKRLQPPIPLDRIVARTTPIDGDAYRSLYITDDLNTDGYRMKRINEGASIPRTTLVTGEHTLRIHKFGRALMATYEQLRRQRIDRLAFILARMALQAEVDKVTDALSVIVSGDGNANTAAAVLNLTALDSVAVAGTLSLKGYLIFKSRFGPAYRANTVLAQEASMMQLGLLTVNTVNGIPMMMLNGSALGGLRPINDVFGGDIAYGITSDAPSLKLVAFDSGQTVERVTEIGGNVSEVERFVHNQTQMFTLTEVEGFAIIDPNASMILNINA
jgi:hypothetical protein